MKNLKLLYEKRTKVICDSKFFTVDNDAAIFFVGTEKCINGYYIENFEKCFELQINETQLCNNSLDKIVGLELLCGEEQLCIATQGGDILLCNTTDKHVECVGTLDCNVSCMSWSPDQEIVLFVTDKGSTVAMNHDFNPIAEIEIFCDAFGEGNFVNVGWGSKETQFQGSAGKYVSGKKTNPDVSIIAPIDKLTKIVWRGDSQYFAISTVEGLNRKFRVWNRDCQLQYTSEPISGLESCLAWKPSGSLIASSQQKINRHDIVFFELNGLQHGEFTLPFKTNEMKIVKLDWNCDSSILALWATSLHSKQSLLHLWTVSNYHWSLKQCIEIKDNLTWMSWDVEHPFILHVLYQNGVYRFLHWSWCTDSSRLSCFNGRNQLVDNLSLVCVIDGAKVKVTLFKLMVIPPPMCAMQMTFKENVKMVCFLESALENSYIGVLLNNRLFVSFVNKKTNFACDDVKVNLVAAGGNGFSSTIDTFGIDGVYYPNPDDFNLDFLKNMRHLVWHAKDQLTVVAFFNNEDHIVTLNLDFSKMQYSCVNCTPVSDSIVGICSGSPVCTVILQYKSGNIYQFKEKLSPFYSNGEEIYLKHICFDMQLCCFQEDDCQDQTYGLIALSFQNRLFLNNIVLSTECTSFYLHQEYILYTTSSHKLILQSKLKPLSELLKTNLAIDLSSNAPGNQVISRSLERGARLVVVTPHNTTTVLQLPRGNLEVIHPRPLALSIVKHHLDNKKFKDAFLLMRKHRINLNLFHDHNPGKFFSSISLFINSLACPEYINLFLGELQEADVTLTMYKLYYPIEHTPIKSLLEISFSKIDKICNAVLKELYEQDPVKYILSILTAYIKKSSPEIDQALTQLKKLKDEKTLNETLVNDGLRHLHVMVDSQILYKEALATYDINLALTVAQVSNNDPKEYVPFLSELKGMEENFKRYQIDMHLKKYDRALENISKCPKHFSKFVELMQQHNLHCKALSLYEKHSSEYIQITNMYSEVLTSQHKYEEAGILLVRCNNHKRAIKCFVAAGHWQHALICAASLQYTKESYFDLGKSVADVLASKNDCISAAFVLQEVGCYKEAITTLCSAKLWSDAHRLARFHDLQDMVDSCIVPALKQSYEDIKLTLQSYRELFDKYYTRLEIVREIKHIKQLQAQRTGDGDGDGDLESDIISDFGSTLTGSSVSSINSRTSKKTAKSRRKQERKRFTLREGSRFEEEGLLQALKGLYTNLLNIKDDIQSLLLHMALHFLDKEGAVLQELYTSTQDLFNRAKSKIWVLPDNASSSFGPESTVNGIIASRANSSNLQLNFDDLEVRLPPKFKVTSNFGMHLYSK